MRIGRNSLVGIRYEILDAEGEVFEEDGTVEPVEYLHGLGELLPGVEQALEGAEPGADVLVELPPGEAYGDYDPAGIVTVPRSDLVGAEHVTPGDWIAVTLEDEGEEAELEMRVVQTDGDAVILDTNHPLAGQKVTFRVHVLSVRPATAAELERAGTDD